MTPNASTLKLVTDEDAHILGLRAEALRRLALRYHKPESQRTMQGSLNRLVKTISGGQRTVASFEWELLVEEDLTSEMWRAVATKYSRATSMKDASFLREMLRSCHRVGLLTHEQYVSARSFETRGGTIGPQTGMFLTPEDVNRLVRSCGSDTPVAMRDAALLLVLASTGARRSEVAAIEIENVHLAEHRIWLQKTKSGKPRNAWLHPTSTAALTAWIERFDPGRSALFPALSRTGRPVEDRAMSGHQVWKIVHHRAERAGLHGMTPHDLRRFVVSTLLDNTHDLALVARVVGHSNPTVTAGYDRRPDQRSRDAVATLALPSWADLTASA